MYFCSSRFHRLLNTVSRLAHAARNTKLASSFRALGRTGLALSLGLTALAAYQNAREAMAENGEQGPVVGDVAAPLMAHHDRLNATTGREVVYCHSCQGEWWRDEDGLQPCPSCGGEITEIVSVPQPCNTDMVYERSA